MDYRDIQEKAKHVQAQIEQLTSFEGADRDKVMTLYGELNALERVAGELRDREIDELRAAVSRGSEVVVTEDDPVADFKAYMRTGTIRNASLSTTDANGGYIVPEPAHGPLVEAVRTSNPFFRECTVFQMTGDTKMYLPVKSTNGVAVTAGETAARSEQNAPTFGNKTLEAFETYTDQRATQQFIDSVDGAEDMILKWIYDDIFTQAEYEMVSGDGTGNSAGLWANTTGYTTALSGAADAISNTAFLTVYFALAAKYRANAKWGMSPATLAVASALAFPGLSDTPLVRWENGVPTIMGKEVVEFDSAPAIGNGAYPIAFGDFKAGYAVGVHRDISVLRDPYSAAPYVRYYGLGRIGGTPWDDQAIVLMKSDNA